MLVLKSILGFASNEPLASAIHELAHDDQVEYLTVEPDAVSRRRFRLDTDKGTDCAVALERDQQIADGAVLLLEKSRAIVIRLSKREWLMLDAPDKASALELGYFVGNLHWKVRFNDGLVQVALEGPRQTYLDRLDGMISTGNAIVVNGDG